jgi:DNA-binding CsgD family transcriptional regulator
VTELLELARHGRSGVLVLHGEAGMGKTVLLDHSRSLAGDMRLMYTCGSEPERHMAFAGLYQAVRPFATRLDELPAAQAVAMRGALALGPAGPKDRFAICAALLSLVSLVAEDGPLLVVVDDAHWLDDPSLEAFAFVARRLMSEGVVLLAAARETDASLLGSARLPTLRLAPFGEAAVSDLVRQIHAVAPDAEVVSALIAATGGNPMALCEVVGGLSAEQLRGRRPLPELVPAKHTADALFAQRVADLSERARTALLLMATVTGDELEPALTAGAELGLPPAVFEEVETGGLARIAGGRFYLAHPLVRSASAAAADAAQRRAAHRAIAAAMSDPRFVDQRTWHVAQATVGTDESVAAALEELADRSLTRGGYAAAVAVLERSVDLTPSSRQRARRLLRAGAAARLAGHNARSLELLGAAETLDADVLLHADIAAIRGRIELFGGRAAHGYRLVMAAGRAVRAVDRRRAAALIADAAMAALLAGDAVAAFEAAFEAESLANPQDHAVGLVTNVVTGLGLLHGGHLADGAERLDAAAAVALGAGSGDLADEYVILVGLGMMWIGQHQEAYPVMIGLVRRLRATGALGWLPLALYVMTHVELRCGRLGDARSAAAEGVELARLGGEVLSIYLALSALAHVEAVIGEEQPCREHAHEALALIPGEADFPRDAAEALALLELGLGRAEEAAEAFAAAYRWPAENVLTESHPDHLEALVRAGRTLPEEAIEENDLRSARTQFPLMAAVAWRLRGLLADDSDLVSCFDAALLLHQQVVCAFETARTRLCAGERLRRAKLRGKAREHLDAALTEFERMGAHIWAKRAHSELAAAGYSVGGQARPSLLEHLTPQEYQVARAVSTGATNREVAAALFLSTKTVEFHLSNVYRKLGVRSRTQMARQLSTLPQ